MPEKVENEGGMMEDKEVDIPEETWPDDDPEPVGCECEGCGARINPDYGRCTRCE